MERNIIDNAKKVKPKLFPINKWCGGKIVGRKVGIIGTDTLGSPHTVTMDEDEFMTLAYKYLERSKKDEDNVREND